MKLRLLLAILAWCSCARKTASNSERDALEEPDVSSALWQACVDNDLDACDVIHVSVGWADHSLGGRLHAHFCAIRLDPYYCGDVHPALLEIACDKLAGFACAKMSRLDTACAAGSISSCMYLSTSSEEFAQRSEHIRGKVPLVALAQAAIAETLEHDGSRMRRLCADGNWLACRDKTLERNIALLTYR